jgi:hypothetical protein
MSSRPRAYSAGRAGKVLAIIFVSVLYRMSEEENRCKREELGLVVGYNKLQLKAIDILSVVFDTRQL